ncbi:MAG: hypothetical protein ISN28_10025 [Ectothiorhodospiraceae bacterium AqS1]|nr:hypothetical protein [Ectothiorhodospiraceae bacterium AqS1]
MKAALSAIMPRLAAAVAVLLLAPLGAQAQLEINRDAVGRMFFTEEERNVMEAVRQGIIDPDVLRPDEQIFVAPQLDIPEIVFNPRIQKVNNVLQRDQEISYQGIIRMKTEDGDGKMLLQAGGGLQLNEQQLESLAETLGLDFHLDGTDSSVIYVDDKLFKTRIALRRGDTIGKTGTVTSQDGGSPRSIIVKKGG